MRTDQINGRHVFPSSSSSSPYSRKYFRAVFSVTVHRLLRFKVEEKIPDDIFFPHTILCTYQMLLFFVSSSFFIFIFIQKKNAATRTFQAFPLQWVLTMAFPCSRLRMRCFCCVPFFSFPSHDVIRAPSSSRVATCDVDALTHKYNEIR